MCTSETLALAQKNPQKEDHQLKKISKITILIIVVLYATYNFILSDFNPMFKNEEFAYLTNALKESRKENFKSIIDIENKIYTVVKQRRCNCETVTTSISPYRHGFSLTKRIYLLKIEKEFSNNECLKYQLLNYDFGNNNIGVQNASKFYFGKTIDKLNVDEKITIVIMLENSSLYNPVRNKRGVRNKLLIYKKILNK